ncbi:aminotransferase class I/II-fold pyridoxal phosphate-dependent enzyme [Sulfurimonas autotrophica]|uniref:histidinol-phosphate transaminase n=1 Tax=Sulfurimonas autotrophica (strain ATCC BAA-671 / DSM 16294 / JCM 11897 / OK10) TaxID=563040 RepID=E0USW0_SULAO|nr:aminotransferase class I/II-fold pyridoxal phosphate-dependent enzyme [Sulfurimonas autotrophica]ADN08137.1 aminotransferase class I and II [Sulfurimonas autotrophica DSM 16294]
MKHGANIYKYAEQLGCNSDEIIDFSSNINLYRPQTALHVNNAALTKYADSSYKELKTVIAKKYALKKSQIALYNGATAAIYALLDSLKQKKVTLYAPLYGEYEKAALQSKKDIYKINRIENIDNEVSKNSIIIFVNPSTPEGSFYELEALFTQWKKKKCTIILDESFLEFEKHPSFRNMIEKYKKLYIIQSFSKFYSCAGLRIGAVFSNKKNIKKLKAPLWNISSLDVEFLQERLGDEAFVEKSLELHTIQKQELLNILKNSGLFEQIVHSDANFILAQSSKAQEIFTHLLEYKILVRTCQSFDYLDENWLRFALKDTDSHKQLQEAFTTFLGDLP